MHLPVDFGLSMPKLRSHRCLLLILWEARLPLYHWFTCNKRTFYISVSKQMLTEFQLSIISEGEISPRNFPILIRVGALECLNVSVYGKYLSFTINIFRFFPHNHICTII